VVQKKLEDFYQKVLLVDVSSGFYRIDHFKVEEYFGPPDLGLFLAGKYNSLNIGTGLLAGSYLVPIDSFSVDFLLAGVGFIFLLWEALV